MIFTPCESCGTLLTDKQQEESITLTEKYLDKPKLLCQSCRVIEINKK